MRSFVRVLQGVTITILWWIFVNVLGTWFYMLMLGPLLLFVLILFPLIVFLIMNIVIPKVHKLIHPNHLEMSSKEELITLVILGLLVLIVYVRSFGKTPF